MTIFLAAITIVLATIACCWRRGSGADDSALSEARGSRSTCPCRRDRGIAAFQVVRDLTRVGARVDADPRSRNVPKCGNPALDCLDSPALRA